MSGEINISGSGDSQQPSFFKRVEIKQEEIKKNSIFQQLTKGKECKYLNETAFLEIVFDKNNDGIISEEEINSVSYSEFMNDKAEYNKDSDDTLVLENLQRTKKELIKNKGVNDNPEKNFIAPFQAALQADFNTEGVEQYFHYALNVNELEKKETLTADEKKLLDVSKENIELISHIMSPDIFEGAQEALKIHLKDKNKQ